MSKAADDDTFADNAYVGDNKRGAPVVVADEDAGTNEGMQGMSAKEADSDRQLQKDEKEAIDERNIMGKKDEGIQTRGVRKDYKEPGDEEGLPGRGDSGSSSLRTGTI